MSWATPYSNYDSQYSKPRLDQTSHCNQSSPSHSEYPHESEPNSLTSTRVLDDAEFDNLPNRTAVTCNVCGKHYKHKLSYIKHQWEHHDSWDTCLKFNVTKHQQVQMMEAAQILVDMLQMNHQPHYFDSDTSSRKDSDHGGYSP